MTDFILISHVSLFAGIILIFKSLKKSRFLFIFIFWIKIGNYLLGWYQLLTYEHVSLSLILSSSCMRIFKKICFLSYPVNHRFYSCKNTSLSRITCWAWNCVHPEDGQWILKIKLQTTPHTMFGSKHSGVVAVKKANEVDIL